MSMEFAVRRYGWIRLDVCFSFFFSIYCVLKPFIDVGVDWIDSPYCVSVGLPTGVKLEHDAGKAKPDGSTQGRHPVPLHEFLSTTPWWMARHNDTVLWDGQSAFIEKSTDTSPGGTDASQKPVTKRSGRSLRKKDVYAAWNAMMKTPRFVRRKLRPRGRLSEEIAVASREQDLAQLSDGEDSSGETIVWRRFMDQISDTSYRADSKRLGDEHLHDLFGEFRHYVVEKYAYNTANRFTGSEPLDVSTFPFVHPRSKVCISNSTLSFYSGHPACSAKLCPILESRRCQEKSFCRNF
jgi:hypothetical protein